MRFGSPHQFLAAACLALLLGASYFALRQGLPGGFLLDDFSNLHHLGAFGTIDTAAEAWLFIQGGTAGPLGRPLSLASFLLDDWTWPSRAAWFKHTNILIHLLCGLLLLQLARSLASELGLPAAVRESGALFGTGLWLLHPVWISTVLYPVQRMAMLSALFCLVALLCYVVGRAALQGGQVRRGAALLFIGFPVAAVAAVLSKENAVLLPALVLVIEYMLLSRSLGRRPLFQAWLFVAASLPVLLGAIGLIAFWETLVLAGFANRDFSLTERLMTQTRVVFEYVTGLLIPGSQSISVFHDDVITSRGLLTPPTTLAGVIFWPLLILTAWLARRRLPLFSASVGFFVAAHALESTVFPLEMVFWHRNYLATTIPFALLGLGLASLVRGRRLTPILSNAAFAGILVALAVSTALHARGWRDPAALSLAWATTKPDSLRAQIDAARTLTDAGRPELARDYLIEADRRFPSRPLLVIEIATLDCLVGATQPSLPIDYSLTTLRAGQLRHHGVDALEILQQIERRKDCGAALGASMETWMDAALANPVLRADAEDLQRVLVQAATLKLAAGTPDAAMETFAEAEALGSGYDFHMVVVSILATHGYYERALERLDHLDGQLRQRDLVSLTPTRVIAARQPLREIERVRALLRADLARSRTRDLAPTSPAQTH